MKERMPTEGERVHYELLINVSSIPTSVLLLKIVFVIFGCNIFLILCCVYVISRLVSVTTIKTGCVTRWIERKQ